MYNVKQLKIHGLMRLINERFCIRYRPLIKRLLIHGRWKKGLNQEMCIRKKSHGHIQLS